MPGPARINIASTGIEGFVLALIDDGGSAKANGALAASWPKPRVSVRVQRASVKGLI